MINFHSLKYIVVSGVLLMISIGFVKTTIEVMQSKSRIEEIENEVIVLGQKKDFLASELEYQKSSEYIEKEARNKLNLIKPNEEVFVVDEDFKKELAKSDVLSSSNVAEEDRKSNFQMWLGLLF